jgi:hypothetical protein
MRLFEEIAKIGRPAFAGSTAFVDTENLLAGAADNLDPVSASKPLFPASAATPVIEKILTQMESEDGWVTLREMGNQFANLASDFDPEPTASAS